MRAIQGWVWWRACILRCYHHHHDHVHQRDISIHRDERGNWTHPAA